MFWWGVEMILHSIKICFRDMLIEERNCFGAEPTLLLGFWETMLVELEVVAVCWFVEFHGIVLIYLDFFVIELEYVISEISFDLNLGWKIDWWLS